MTSKLIVTGGSVKDSIGQNDIHFEQLMAYDAHCRNILVCRHRAAAKSLQAKVVDVTAILQCCSSCLYLLLCCPLYFTQRDLELIPCSPKKPTSDVETKYTMHL